MVIYCSRWQKRISVPGGHEHRWGNPCWGGARVLNHSINLFESFTALSMCPYCYIVLIYNSFFCFKRGFHVLYISIGRLIMLLFAVAWFSNPKPTKGHLYINHNLYITVSEPYACVLFISSRPMLSVFKDMSRDLLRPEATISMCIYSHHFKTRENGG